MDLLLARQPDRAQLFTGNLWRSRSEILFHNRLLRSAARFCLLATGRGEVSAAMQKSRTPLTIGWQAARANAVPALIIQGIMLALLIAYYTNHAAFSALNQLADYKRTHGLVFVIAASITAGALIPEIFLILFFQCGRPNSRNLCNLLFTVQVWGFDV